MNSLCLRLIAVSILSACSGTASDRAANLLARDGTVAVTAAGPFVEIGTFRVQVAAKLGRPDLVLRDGAWLYHHRRIDGSAAEGTLVVRFDGGRVAALSVVTPAVVAALREAAPAKPHASELVATK